jgi:hypothetical protein
MRNWGRATSPRVLPAEQTGLRSPPVAFPPPVPLPPPEGDPPPPELPLDPPPPPPLQQVMTVQTAKTPKIPMILKMLRIMLYHSLMGGYLLIFPYLKSCRFFMISSFGRMGKFS